MQRHGIRNPRSIIQEVTGVEPRVQANILQSKETWTCHNRPDSVPDPRGRTNALKRSETAAIANYLDDPKVPLDNKGKPWQDVTEEAGVILPETLHFKPAGSRTLHPRTIQRSRKKDEDIPNAVCEEEKELVRKAVDERLDFIDAQLEVRPHSNDWKRYSFL